MLMNWLMWNISTRPHGRGDARESSKDVARGCWFTQLELSALSLPILKRSQQRPVQADLTVGRSLKDG